ncbi:MAG: hypothetical protein ABL949_07115 [Fimbriimonadaceae bacterium]
MPEQPRTWVEVVAALTGQGILHHEIRLFRKKSKEVLISIRVPWDSDKQYVLAMQVNPDGKIGMVDKLTMDRLHKESPLSIKLDKKYGAWVEQVFKNFPEETDSLSVGVVDRPFKIKSKQCAGTVFVQNMFDINHMHVFSLDYLNQIVEYRKIIDMNEPGSLD